LESSDFRKNHWIPGCILSLGMVWFNSTKCKAFVFLVMLALVQARQASAALMVLVGEPFGAFGTMMPVGHTAVYLDRVCADGPLHLRMCDPNEPQGVVIARYHGIEGVDWMASPIMEFLYAVDRKEDIPEFATPEMIWEMRQTYRRRYLSDIVPDGTEKAKRTGEWWESVGMAYNRRLWGYELATSREQDELLVATLNSHSNVHTYSLRRANCANFAADVVNLYYPQTVKVNRWADLGMMTPKQVGRSVQSYGKKHPDAAMRVVEIPQVLGKLRRSRPVRGTAESALKTKRYLLTLLAIQPEVIAGLGVAYLKQGRWTIGQGATVVGPEAFELRPAEVVESNTDSVSFGGTPAVGRPSLQR
jgi:hypothetical protein